MATTSPVRKAWRSLIWLIVIVVGLVALNVGSMLWSNNSLTPKLALDLEGGTQIILEPQLESGQTVSQEQLDQAVAIIRQRVDATGVSESEITTQGGRNIIVAIPGTPDNDTMERIQASAKLEFRPVLRADVPTPQGGASVEPTPAPDGGGDSTAAPDSTAPAESAAPETPAAGETPSPQPTNASDLAWITPELESQFANFDCSSLDELTQVPPSDKPFISCEEDGSVKYILGPVEVSGETITDATSGLVPDSRGFTTNEWGVFITFNETGTREFRAVTERLIGLSGTQNQFAIVLDGKVISAPTTQAVITDGKPMISGNFTQESAKRLADQLKFGALPIGFQVESTNTISATLGANQLHSGLIAGVIGMILVVVYSLFQYRTLGLVTVASLIVAAIITYLVITLLSWREGYRLSLAGVAGLIVAIGIIADSFIVYFERIRDELRDGRSLEGAVEAGWKRAIRTVLASDTINFLAAVVLFLVAVGNVQGFAFTLGITTIIDLIVVSLFTHPMLQLLARTRFFGGGHPWSGLDPQALGAVYRGRAQFRAPVAATGRGARSSREAQRRQTIAERKAAEQAGVGAGERDSSGKDA
ncbi:protein translocase subunit SecD [Ruicaihuangia caeni]|uniref:Protein translocase subunit SecD n=1 Tax=Ruicaihuangia caeni TaxID=3042517 RepID=A0AAW6T7H4_9MICO|nr:protein translocase subunit SecD [Klugiella sp. YN-L-19]MDI2098050.1 protein translocase subunit SecD [Klugiella sp. YN-L-19]